MKWNCLFEKLDCMRRAQWKDKIKCEILLCRNVFKKENRRERQKEWKKKKKKERNWTEMKCSILNNMHRAFIPWAHKSSKKKIKHWKETWIERHTHIDIDPLVPSFFFHSLSLHFFALFFFLGACCFLKTFIVFFGTVVSYLIPCTQICELNVYCTHTQNPYRSFRWIKWYYTTVKCKSQIAVGIRH